MTNKAENMMKGIGAAMAVTGTAAMIVTAASSSSSTMKKMKKSAGKAIKSVEHALGGISDMMV